MLLSQLRHSCKSDPTQKPSNAEIHIWSPFLHSKPGSLHSSTSSFWGANRHFPFLKGHCAQTQLRPFSKNPSTKLQISKADFILLDVEHKLYYNLWGKSSPSSNFQILFWAVHILKSPCSLANLLGWNCSDSVHLLKTPVKINNLKRNPLYPGFLVQNTNKGRECSGSNLLPWALVCRVL